QVKLYVDPQMIVARPTTGSQMSGRARKIGITGQGWPRAALRWLLIDRARGRTHLAVYHEIRQAPLARLERIMAQRAAAATRSPMPATTPARCRRGSATRTSSTRCAIPSWPPTGLRTSGDRRFAAAGAAAPCVPAPFRTIQVYPKDLRALPVHPKPALSWHSGFRGGAHARPQTTPVHHAARRCGSGVAARGARAA